MSRQDPALMVRLPGELKERLRKQADADRRTLTGEVIYLLERALHSTETATGATPGSTTPVAVES